MSINIKYKKKAGKASKIKITEVIYVNYTVHFTPIVGLNINR